jgi:hypothetical protein
MDKGLAIETATKRNIEAGERILSNVTFRYSTFEFAFFNNGMAYVRITDGNGVARNAYAKNYGITVRSH